ncbi:MAG: thiamine diphosphokinase [Bacteroidetes bacterium]|uniref:Thiamine diphosphokinase n=1 Tax=Candidatus Cryptobacteroides intestinavium TaxID=2840766 RepID=A0A9D9ER66_9BACT|nr:thiamine diphosphokinase [Candidatus Cryptobacteroides intestinavium]
MNRSAVIIGNGDFPKKEYPLYLLSRADYIVCCDGALDRYLRYTRDHSMTRLPDAVIGDMDSISASSRKKYAHLAVKVDDQETNDQTKAFDYVIRTFKDVSEIIFLAATGKREDHTLGNMSLLMEYARRDDVKASGIHIEMVSDYSTIIPVTDSTELDCGQGRSISIISPDSSLRIRSKGLQWPTDNVIFDNWWKATLNRASEDTVKLTFSHPSAALVIMD